jgi:TRAP transporter TAXI family solute receptor
LYALGEITARVLAPHGYEINVLDEPAGPQNPRFVADGRADLGATQPATVYHAYEGIGEFASEGPRHNLRAIASICRPYFVAVAVTHESGITDLSQIKERRLPVRISAGAGSETILGHYGLTREEIVSYGGQNVSGGDDAGVDLIIANMYLANTPAGRRWLDASSALDLRFLDLPEPLIDRLIAEGDGEPGFIPSGYIRGVDHDVATVSRPYLVIYTRDGAPDELVRTLARGYDQNRRYFRETHVAFSYDPVEAPLHTKIPLHPAALAYYEERKA